MKSQGANAEDCAFKITANIKVQWWDVGNSLIVYRTGSLPTEGAEFVLYKGEPLSNEGTVSAEIELPALVDHPEAFRSQVAKWLRNAVLKTLNSSTLKFP